MNKEDRKEILKEITKEFKDWGYGYTRYPIQMRTKKDFDKGIMAKELTKDLLSKLNNLE